MKSGYLCAFLAAAAALNLGAAEPKLVFHADFDKDFKAAAANKTEVGRHSVAINMETLSMLLQNGVKGQAAKVGMQDVRGQKKASFIHYSGKQINGEKGTVAFWLKPLDWSFNDRKYHAVLQAWGPTGGFALYKHRAGSSMSLFFGNARNGKMGTGYVGCRIPNLKWERGEFRHVVLTWDKDFVQLYLDGVRTNREKMASKAPFKNITLFSVGFLSINGWHDEAGESLIDDLRVYDQALAEKEIEKLFSSYGVKKLDKSAIPVKFTAAKLLASPDNKAIDLTVSLSRTTQKGTGFPIEMEVLKDKKSVLKKVLTSNTPDYSYSFDLAKWKEGDYQLNLRPVREADTDKIENKSLIFTIKDYKPIVDHSVPEPWKPVIFKNNQFSALMQKTVFSKELFPSQLFSEKTPLLRNNIQFICNNKAVNGKVSSKIVEKHPDYQILERRITGKDFDLVSRCRFEFDGMMWYDVTLVPKGKVQVRNAKIEIPLRKETSTLYNCFVRDYFKISGHFAGKLTKTVKRNHYQTNSDGKLPVMWMGNEERGLYYFTQDQAGRRLKNRAETVRLDPVKEGALFTINLIDYASVLDKPVTWSFGLHVTPVRPFVRNRIFWRASTYAYKGVGVVSWFPWADIHNVPESRFKISNYDTRRYHLSGRNRIPIFHYFAGFSTSPENPSYPQHANDWSITPPAVGTEASSNSREWRYVFVCTNSASYRSYYLQNLAKCIKDLNMEYLYFDNDLSYYCANTSHGCGWKDEHGKIYPSSNMLGTRELAKGCYRLHRKQFPKGKIIRHLSQTPESSLVAFCDCILDGESFVDNVASDENYFKVFKPDYVRASFRGNQFGVPIFYMQQFLRSYGLHAPEKLALARQDKLKNQELHQRHQMGYMYAHDIGTHALDTKAIRPFWDVLAAAGVGNNTAFWGYWDKNNPVRKISPADERVMVSSYAAKDGVLIMMLNDMDQTAVVNMAFDQKTLGKSPIVYNAETKENVNPKAFSIPARSVRMLRVVTK